MPHVLIQEEGAHEPLDQWFVSDSSVKEKRAWERVCGLLVSRAIEGHRSSHINVFFVFDEEEVMDRDRPTLRNLLADARARTWGARMILVLSNALLIHSVERPAAVDLAEWLTEVLAGRVSDLIQIPQRMNVNAPRPLFRALRDAASAVSKRQKTLIASMSPRRWRCALPEGWFHFADVLGPELVVSSSEHEASSDLVIVLPPGDPERQKTEVEKYLSSGDSSRRLLIATYMHEPALSLQHYCGDGGLQTISVGGDFELWYLLLRLNEHAHERRAEDSYSVHPVPLAARPRLIVSKAEDAPTLLVTSVFDRAEVGQWLAAASEVGELLHRIPFGIKRRIELGVTPERLTVILGEMPVVSIWIHIGHGEGKTGLRVPGDGSVDVDKWLHCFNGRDLRLALFLTCDSDVVAKRFAEEGTSVAIGFHGDVESHKTWHLAVEIVKAIVAEGTRGGTILTGFDAGLQRFEAVQKLDARARAYYPRQV